MDLREKKRNQKIEYSKSPKTHKKLFGWEKNRDTTANAEKMWARLWNEHNMDYFDAYIFAVESDVFLRKTNCFYKIIWNLSNECHVNQVHKTVIISSSVFNRHIISNAAHLLTTRNYY